MIDILKNEAHKHGDKLSAISVDRLVDVKAGFDNIGIDSSLYFSFDKPTDIGFDVASVLVVATPSLPDYAVFETDDYNVKALIPPVYKDTEKKESFINDYLSTALAENRYHVTTVQNLPCKPIAAHSGLGIYGYNNIIYVEGMGSFHKLFLFFSDVPCDYENFTPLRRLDSCEKCGLCVANCPTGALKQDCDTVDIECCITDHNERDKDFPDWLKPEWHNALIGCVRCQYVCPQNKKYLDSEKEIARFSRGQTEAFINGEQSDDIIKQLGIDSWYDNLLSRNLTALIRAAIMLEAPIEHDTKHLFFARM